jgi:hypothetical protein
MATIWLSLNFDVFIEDPLGLDYENILLLTAVTFRGDYPMTAAANRESWVFPLGIILLLLPFFAFYTLLAMLLATVTYFFTCIRIANKQNNQAYFAAFMIYMMGQLAALIIYAVFF